MMTSGSMPKAQVMGMKKSKKEKHHSESREAHHEMHEKKQKLGMKKSKKDCY